MAAVNHNAPALLPEHLGCPRKTPLLHPSDHGHGKRQVHHTCMAGEKHHSSDDLARVCSTFLMCAFPTRPGPRVVSMLTFTVPLAILSPQTPPRCTHALQMVGKSLIKSMNVAWKYRKYENSCARVCFRMVSCNVSASSTKLLATDNKKSPTVKRAQVSKQEKCPFGWEKCEESQQQ